MKAEKHSPRPSSRLVVLVGDGQDWPPGLESLLAHEGYATEHRGELDAALPLVEGSLVRALLVVARPLGASDLLILKRVRESSPRTAIVAVTKTPTSPDLKRAFESGATAFLSWPASKEALRQAVDSGGVPAERS
jgi:DNA-binding NtrC family response regulator